MKPILSLNNDLDKDKQIRAAYKIGMETYADLITKAPDENGIYDNFSNNSKKLNELMKLLYIIKVDFEKHIKSDIDSQELYLKKQNLSKRKTDR